MSYEVKETEFGVLVFGSIPIGDMVALSNVWEERGLKFLAPGVAAALKATLAVTNDVLAWQAAIDTGVVSHHPGDEELQWLLGTDTGTSSKTIFAVLCRDDLREAAKRSGYPDLPHDIDDFGRCYRLLQQFPAWKARLPEVAKAHKAWKPFVDQWPRMEALYPNAITSGRGTRDADDLYTIIRDLRKP